MTAISAVFLIASLGVGLNKQKKDNYSSNVITAC